MPQTKMTRSAARLKTANRDPQRPPKRVTPRKRTRKAPEERRAEILDSAARLVLAEGLTAVSMERLARDTGISKALVYNYFASRDHLFAALLKREQVELQERGLGAALRAESFPELVRQTTRVYLEQVQSRGALIAALLSDPSVAKLIESENVEARQRTRTFFVRQVAKDYNLAPNIAAVSVDLLWAITDGAGRQFSLGVIDIDTAEEMCVQLIIGALERLSRKGKALRALRLVEGS
jgi:AcrR family transcriptional regulator